LCDCEARIKCGKSEDSLYWWKLLRLSRSWFSVSSLRLHVHSVFLVWSSTPPYIAWAFPWCWRILGASLLLLMSRQPSFTAPAWSVFGSNMQTSQRCCKRRADRTMPEWGMYKVQEMGQIEVLDSPVWIRCYFTRYLHVTAIKMRNLQSAQKRGKHTLHMPHERAEIFVLLFTDWVEKREFFFYPNFITLFWKHVQGKGGSTVWRVT